MPCGTFRYFLKQSANLNTKNRFFRRNIFSKLKDLVLLSFFDIIKTKEDLALHFKGRRNNETRKLTEHRFVYFVKIYLRIVFQSTLRVILE